MQCINKLYLLISDIDSSPFSATYMRQWIESALVQIMACRLFGAKPFSKPMLGYYRLWHVRTKFSETLIKMQRYDSRKFIWKYRLRSGSHLVLGEMGQIKLSHQYDILSLIAFLILSHQYHILPLFTFLISFSIIALQWHHNGHSRPLWCHCNAMIENELCAKIGDIREKDDLGFVLSSRQGGQRWHWEEYVSQGAI